MIDLRFIIRDGQRILQWRQICVIIEDVAGYMVFAPAPPVYMTMDRNWTEWEDVPLSEVENRRPENVT